MSEATMVTFEDVGREKRCWKARFKGGVCEGLLDELPGEARRGGKLMSRDVSVSYDPNTKDGRIIVGGFRTVGRFRVDSVEPAP